MNATTAKPTLAELRAKLTELQGERDKVATRLAESSQREADARYEVYASSLETRPGAVNGVNAIIRKRREDEGALAGLDADIATLTRLIVEAEQEARIDAANDARFELGETHGGECAAVEMMVELFLDLYREYEEKYIPAAKAYELMRREVFGKAQAAGLAGDFETWAQSAPRWTLPSIPRTFKALLETLYEGSVRNSMVGLGLANAIGDLIPPLADPEHEFQGDTPSHGGHYRPQSEFIGA